MMSATSSASARRAKPKTIAALHELIQKIEGEYRQMPGLSVTAPQAQRLWGLDSMSCGFVLMTLIQRGVLRHTASGTFVRR